MRSSDLWNSRILEAVAGYHEGTHRISERRKRADIGRICRDVGDDHHYDVRCRLPVWANNRHNLGRYQKRDGQPRGEIIESKRTPNFSR
jgi:hypothetical protein